jgi:hypothetical protein
MLMLTPYSGRNTSESSRQVRRRPLADAEISEISLVLNVPPFPQAQAAAGAGGVHARDVHHTQDVNELFDAGMSVFHVIPICECRGADMILVIPVPETKHVET